MRLCASLITAGRKHLKLKLILFVVAMLGLTIGIAPWSAIQMQRQQLLAGAGEHVRSLDEILRALIDASMVVKEQAKGQRVLETVGSHEGVTAARIFDTDGVIHSSSHREGRGRVS